MVGELVEEEIVFGDLHKLQHLLIIFLTLIMSIIFLWHSEVAEWPLAGFGRRRLAQQWDCL